MTGLGAGCTMGSLMGGSGSCAEGEGYCGEGEGFCGVAGEAPGGAWFCAGFWAVESDWVEPLFCGLVESCDCKATAAKTGVGIAANVKLSTASFRGL